MQTQVRVSNWVEGQKYHLPYYRHPVVDTKPPSKTSRSTTTSSTPPSTAKDQSAPKQSNTVHRRSNTTRTGSKTTARRPGVQARSNSVPSRRDHRKSVSPEPPAKLRRSSNQQNPVRKDIPQSRNSSTRDGHPGRSYTTTSPNRPVLMNNGLLVFLQNGSYAHYRVRLPIHRLFYFLRASKAHSPFRCPAHWLK